MKNANDPNLYYFVVELHGQVILDGRLSPALSGQHLCWSEGCADCIPYADLPKTPVGDDQYTSCEMSSGDSCDTDFLDELAETSTYWPTLEDWRNCRNGIPGTVEVNDADRTVRFTYL